MLSLLSLKSGRRRRRGEGGGKEKGRKRTKGIL